MARRILITGGAGFIGSHVTDELLDAGYEVRVLDNLTPQVHGPERRRPAYLAREAELRVGVVSDRSALRKALDGVEAVVHLAARVGVGQSMYELETYTATNVVGTGVLLEEVVRHRSVERLVVASSMSVYGEGLYASSDGAVHFAAERDGDQIRRGDWEVRSPAKEILGPLPTPETKPPSLASVYALTKFDQERLCLITGRAYGIPTVALRLFNVYGPRQALSNPYTGVLAIFACRLLNGKPPLVYEDGAQRRDFVSVHDVARAFRLALDAPDLDSAVLNIGSGASHTIREIAHRLASALGREELEPVITGTYRSGDIRHCFADIRRARERLGYHPRISLQQGLRELTTWLEGQIADDHLEKASAELSARGLAI